MNSIKTKKQVLAENSEYKTLINAVYNRIGKESIQDVNNYGINGGYSGFIYYSETAKFYSRYRKLINKLVFEMAESFGEEAQNMVLNFNCVNSDNESKHDIAICLYGGNLRTLKDEFHLPNALAWFAAEEVCRMFENW
jgi:hypothetical protein